MSYQLKPPISDRDGATQTIIPVILLNGAFYDYDATDCFVHPSAINAVIEFIVTSHDLKRRGVTAPAMARSA